MASANPFISLDASQFAHQAQSRIFPSARPSIPGLDYYSDWRPACGAGGDYLDYFEMDAGNFGLAIGEVSAEGVEAALLTTSLHSIVRALRYSHTRSLAEFVSTADELFCEICPDGCYATLFLASYDPVLGRLHYVNAGHEPPFILRQSGRQRDQRLDTGGPLLGMLRKSRYREGIVALSPGDVLVAYTEGLCDAANAQGEPWGWTRFVESLQAGPRRRARDMVAQVFDAHIEFTAGAPQVSDRTLWVGRIEETHALPVLHLAEPVEELVAA